MESSNSGDSDFQSIEKPRMTFTLRVKRKKTTFYLLNRKNAISRLQLRDSFTDSMSLFDLQIRVGSCYEPNLNEYFQSVEDQIMRWNEDCISVVKNTILALKGSDIVKCIDLPKSIFIVLTNGYDEGCASYTRINNVIMIPIQLLLYDQYNYMLNNFPCNIILCRQLFHLMTKRNPSLRDDLYSTINYKKIPTGHNIDLPDSLRDFKITNPDAPYSRHYLQVTETITGNDILVAPLMMASCPFDPSYNATLFEYCVPVLVVLDEKTFLPKTNAKLLDYDDVDGFFENVGRNSLNNVHPEEIVADNFLHLLFNNFNVPNPEILRNIESVLKKY